MDSPLKWYGGKHYLAKKILQEFPTDYVHYVEPYAGSLAVLLEHNPNNRSELVNDLNGELTNFWKVFRDPEQFEKLQFALNLTPFSENAFTDSMDNINSINLPIDIMSAYNFFIRCRQSRAGTMKDFATVTRNRIRRGMNEQVSAWLNSIERLPEVHARLIRVLIMNQPAMQVIDSQDGENTFFYLDPPYVHDTRSSVGQYQYEMTETQHVTLLNRLTYIKGKFLLSGYHNKLYDGFAERNNWRIHEFDIPCMVASGSTKQERTEVVYANY